MAYGGNYNLHIVNGALNMERNAFRHKTFAMSFRYGDVSRTMARFLGTAPPSSIRRKNPSANWKFYISSHPAFPQMSRLM